MDILKEKNLRRTPIRLKMLDVFKKNSLLTVGELYKLLKMDIPLSTVYRAIDSFEEKSIIKKVTIDETTYYELVHEHHCHHLICNQCKKVIHVHKCPLQPYELEISDNYGFMVVEHELNLYGICKECQEKDMVGE